MKIEELSVGDWVAYNGKKYRIKQISSPYASVTLWGNNEQRDESIVLIVPIRLTPEILEKNGISKTYESDEYAVYKGEGFNVTEYYTELWEFEKHRNRLMIRNVHQLQHALRLAGVGKEIEV